MATNCDLPSINVNCLRSRNHGSESRSCNSVYSIWLSVDVVWGLNSDNKPRSDFRCNVSLLSRSFQSSNKNDRTNLSSLEFWYSKESACGRIGVRIRKTTKLENVCRVFARLDRFSPWAYRCYDKSTNAH
jgi:hypothetical protein